MAGAIGCGLSDNGCNELAILGGGTALGAVFGATVGGVLGGIARPGEYRWVREWSAAPPVRRDRLRF